MWLPEHKHYRTGIMGPWCEGLETLLYCYSTISKALCSLEWLRVSHHHLPPGIDCSRYVIGKEKAWGYVHSLSWYNPEVTHIISANISWARTVLHLVAGKPEKHGVYSEQDSITNIGSAPVASANLLPSQSFLREQHKWLFLLPITGLPSTGIPRLMLI